MLNLAVCFVVILTAQIQYVDEKVNLISKTKVVMDS